MPRLPVLAKKKSCLMHSDHITLIYKEQAMDCSEAISPQTRHTHTQKHNARWHISGQVLKIILILTLIFSQKFETEKPLTFKNQESKRKKDQFMEYLIVDKMKRSQVRRPNVLCNERMYTIETIKATQLTRRRPIHQDVESLDVESTPTQLSSFHCLIVVCISVHCTDNYVGPRICERFILCLINRFMN